MAAVTEPRLILVEGEALGAGTSGREALGDVLRWLRDLGTAVVVAGGLDALELGRHLHADAVHRLTGGVLRSWADGTP
jgi:hypothetical protein